MKRSQAAQIRRAQKLARLDARIWLPGGLEMRVPHAGSSTLVADQAETRNPAQTRKKPRLAGEKQSPRGAKPTKSD